MTNQYVQPTKQELIELNHKKRMNVSSIAKKFQTSPNRINYFFDKYGIQYKKLFDFLQEDIPKDKLIQLHHGEERSLPEIGEMLNVSRYNINSLMQHYGIEIKRFKRTHIEITEIVSEETLRKLHHEEKKSLREIAKILNTNYHYIQALCKRYGIEVIKYPSNKVYISKKTLLDLYVKQGLTTKEIANKLGTSSKTVGNRMREYGIPYRQRQKSGETLKMQHEMVKNICPWCGKYHEVEEWKLPNPEGFCASCNDKIGKKASTIRRRSKDKGHEPFLTPSDLRKIIVDFGNECPLTGLDGVTNMLHIDHFIPLEMGGETCRGNLIMLHPFLNDRSKGSSHPIDWGESLVRLGLIESKKWENLLEYLSKTNNMTIKNYRQYVDYLYIENIKNKL